MAAGPSTAFWEMPRRSSAIARLIHELTFGATRHFYSLSEEVIARLTTPLKPRDSIVFCLLVVGAYQLRHTRIPGYAAVNETVNATQQIGRPWARGLVNQILRRIASEPAPATQSEEAAFDHPQWLIDAIRTDYPDRWREILQANQTRAPLSLRVNLVSHDPRSTPGVVGCEQCERPLRRSRRVRRVGRTDRDGWHRRS